MAGDGTAYGQSGNRSVFKIALLITDTDVIENVMDHARKESQTPVLFKHRACQVGWLFKEQTYCSIRKQQYSCAPQA